MQLKFSKRFKKSYAKLTKKEQKNVDEAVLLFIKDPLNKRLRNHALKGDYKEVWSLDAGFDLRILYTQRIIENDKVTIAVMIDVGSHAYLYG